MARTGLGRGLSTLIPEGVVVDELIDPSETVKNLPISKITPNPNQPRTVFDESNLRELAESIKLHGVIQPIIVSPKGGEYLIIAGERRWRASKIAGQKTVPAVVRSVKELQVLEMALIENVQRVDLGPIEQAISIERLHQNFSQTYAEIAKKLGKSSSTVNNLVRLLKLPEEAKLALLEGLISEGHARQVLALTDEVEQKDFLKKIINLGWSVRQAEAYVLAKKSEKTEIAVSSNSVDDYKKDVQQLTKKLGTSVRIKRTAKGGRLEVSFKDEDDLRRLIDQLG